MNINMNIRRIIRETIEDYLKEAEPAKTEMLSGKEIIASTEDGYYYHGSHIPSLTKNNVNLFSKASDFGNSEAGDRYGFYITNSSKAYTYSFAWIQGGDTFIKLSKEGRGIVEKIRKDSLLSSDYSIESLSSVTGIPKEAIEFIYNEYKKDIGYEPFKESDIIEYGISWPQEDGNKFYNKFLSFLKSPDYDKWSKRDTGWNKYKAPYSLIEEFAKKQGLKPSEIYKIRTGELPYWQLFGIIAAVKRGFWPTVYRIKLRPDDMFIPTLNLDIDHSEFNEYTKLGAVGIYNGKLSATYSDDRDEVAILKRDAIASMEKVGDSDYFKFGAKFNKDISEGQRQMWEFAKKLVYEH
jgi:hypothetical protein